jgi:HSP20 family protein
MKSSTEPAKSYRVPPASISATGEEYLLELDMPGVNKDGLEILIEGNELTITGRKHPAPVGGAVQHRESSDADFRRTFELATPIDTGRVNAAIEQGVLKLRLPISEQVKPRKITIND